MTKIVAFLNDDSGASAAEYALILAIVGAAIAAAALTLGKTIANALSDASGCISDGKC
jgi:pilus assembly protein Flp/PilA